MTPKEKAEEIVLKFEESLYGYDVFDDDWVKCINCALIAVQEIDKELRVNLEPNFTKKFWLEVKQEIEKL